MKCLLPLNQTDISRQFLTKHPVLLHLSDIRQIQARSYARSRKYETQSVDVLTMTNDIFQSRFAQNGFGDTGRYISILYDANILNPFRERTIPFIWHSKHHGCRRPHVSANMRSQGISSLPEYSGLNLECYDALTPIHERLPFRTMSTG